MAAAAFVLSPFWGYVRADQIPTYGDSIIPFVFLARLNALAVVPFVAFYAVLSTGGDFAASRPRLSSARRLRWREEGLLYLRIPLGFRLGSDSTSGY